MNIRRIVFYLFFMIICGLPSANAAKTTQCLVELGKDKTLFIDVLKSEFLKGKELNQKLVDSKKHELYNMLSSNVILHCLDTKHLTDFNEYIVDSKKLKIPFQIDNKYYQFNANTDELFEHSDLAAAIMVTSLKNKTAGDVITKGELPTDYFFSSECSDHWVRVNIDNAVPVNVAGQVAFTKYKDKEFFIDFPFGKNNRAFPGLIIAAKKGVGGSEEVVWYRNYKTAREAAQKFANALKGTACANQDLVVDVVSLKTVPVTQGDKTGWTIGAGVAGGTAIAVGFLVSNPVGWVIASIAAAGGAAATAIAPKSLADLQQVMILDGPYLIK